MGMRSRRETISKAIMRSGSVPAEESALMGAQFNRLSFLEGGRSSEWCEIHELWKDQIPRGRDDSKSYELVGA